MTHILLGFKVAILLTSGFQETEMTLPRKALQDAGVIVHIVSPDEGTVKGWDCDVPKVTGEFKVDVPLSQARAQDYDALLIPGGYGSPEELRLNEQAIAFVKGFAKKPIAAICHGPSLLIDAQLVRNKKLTSYAAIKRDLLNAGAQWIDQAVVRDGNLVTSRMPDDISAFNTAIIELFSEYARKINKKTMNNKTIYYVTGNPSKFKLFSQFVPADSGIELKQFACNLYEEQIEDQEAIAISKAKQAWDLLKQPLLVDEVGVYFHKYNNFPGAFTKFVYKGLGFDGIYKLMKDGDELSILLKVVYMFGENEFKVFTTKVSGTFKKPIEQKHDFHAPFDLVFMPNGLDKSYVELEQVPEIYNEVYFRSLAMKQIVQFIKNPIF